MLGTLEIEGNDFRRPKPLLLLAYLTLNGPQLRSHLAQLFWPNNPQGNRSLTTTIGRLKAAESRAVIADDSRAWSTLTSDVQQLRRDLGDGDLESALALYRGPFLDGLELPQWTAELEEWVYEEREALAEELRSALLGRARLEAGRGRLERAGVWAERALGLAGAAAPDPEILTQLHALLKASDHPLAAKAAAEAAGFGLSLPDSPAAARHALEAQQPATPPHNLPTRGGVFIGREIELAELRQTLDAAGCRLLTLVGQGGAGKTRLALQLAKESLAAGFDGIYFIGLESSEDPASATATLAEALGVDVPSGTEALAALARSIGVRRLLLVLDNLEQLSGSASLVGRLLERCENLKVVATSRAPLDLGAEWVVPIDGLSYPTMELPATEVRMYDAVQLFALRARQVTSVQELSDEDLHHVVRLCKLLQGAPLGLELAASLMRVLPCSEIADEAERNFDSLARSSSSGEHERHQSLRSAFDHSWKLLSPQDRSMLERLTVFRGGFSRPAALEVTEGSATTLVSLVDKSLVYRTADDRFGLHSVTRQYAHEHMLEDEANYEKTRDRHARRLLQLAETAESHLKGPEQVKWLTSLAVERDNLRAALDWSVRQQRVELGLRLATALQHFWWLRGPYEEGYTYLTTLLALSQEPGDPELRAKALHRAGTLCQQMGDRKTAAEHYEAAQELAESHRDEQLLCDALHSRALVTFQLGDREASTALFTRCLDLQRGIGDRWGVAMTLNNMASNELDVGQLERARELISESLAIKEELGDVQGIAYALNNLGNVVMELGEMAAAKTMLERSLSLKRQLDDRGGVAISLSNLARIARAEGRFDDALELLAKALRTLEPLENGWTLTTLLSELAELEEQTGRPERALRLAGGVESLSAALADGGGVGNVEGLDEVTRQATARVGPPAAARLLREGKAMDVGALIDWACEDTEPGTHTTSSRSTPSLSSTRSGP